MAFPIRAARAEALSELIEMPELLAAPNNILALEYITALKKSCSSIQPIPVARKGNGYHDPDSDCFFASASAIRRAIQCENDIDLQEGLPETSRKIIAAGFQRELPMRPEDISSMFAASFLRSASDLSRYMDVTEEIANRMLSFFKNYRSLPDFLMKIKNRAFTYSRLCRCAAHILLELDKETFVRAQADDYAYYARVLGFEGCRAASGIYEKEYGHPHIDKNVFLSGNFVRQWPEAFGGRISGLPIIIAQRFK